MRDADGLDAAIDRVASEIVHRPDDGFTAARVAARIEGESARHRPWPPIWATAGIAGIVLVAIAVVVTRMNQPAGTTHRLATEAVTAGIERGDGAARPSTLTSASGGDGDEPAASAERDTPRAAVLAAPGAWASDAGQGLEPLAHIAALEVAVLPSGHGPDPAAEVAPLLVEELQIAPLVLTPPE